MQTAPYGAWRSPITSDLIVAETIRLGGVSFDGEDIYWLEGRPTEAGRNVLVRCTADGISDVTPAPFNVRTRVHEYGGGAYLVERGTVYFVNFADQRIYRQTGTQPEPLTPESARRYADASLDRQRSRLICVCENYTQADQEPKNTLVTVDLETGTVQELVQGSDFYSSPRLSPDGGQMAWLSWNHPNMPWDSTELWLAQIEADGSLGGAQQDCWRRRRVYWRTPVVSRWSALFSKRSHRLVESLSTERGC